MLVDHVDRNGGVLFDDVGEEVDVSMFVGKNELSCGFSP